MNNVLWRPPLHSFDVMTIPVEKLFTNRRRSRESSFDCSSSDDDSETYAGNGKDDIPERPHVLDEI